MNTYWSTIDTPIGPFTALVDDEGQVLASGWTAQADALHTLIHPSLRDDLRTRRDLGAVTAAVRAYHEGNLSAPDAIPVRQHTGGAFLPAAWKALRDVRPCARNAAALFVPCHRVVRVGGALGGFRWGIGVKQWLLAHEA
jgi:methylated-DNA-[protein]-cysteine S-methyltransferase